MVKNQNVSAVNHASMYMYLILRHICLTIENVNLIKAFM